MKGWIIFLIVTILIIVISIIVFIVIKMNKNTLPAFQPATESYLDPTISAPTQNLFLSNFENNTSLNLLPWCTPSWYGLRYVRKSDGGYGPITWMPSQYQVQSGSSSLPCLNTSNNSYTNQCSFTQNGKIVTINNASSTCNYNVVSIGTPSELTYSIEDGYYANIHRQDGTFSTSSNGKIIGILVPSDGAFKYYWEDVLYPANVSDYTCNNVQSCKN
jgi:hypothetical protein